MKDNGPVTQKEHLLPPDTKIVSFTDLHGTITHANEAFIDASGYEWSELIGQAHDILRHPDVPAVVFKDFWETIQAGKPWSQIVKNRCKNGDHYWVRANATPIFENGKVVSYMSFRTPASNTEKQAATHAYKEINAGRMQIKNGVIVGVKERINLLEKLNPTSLIIASSGFLAVIALLLAFVPSLLETVPAYLFALLAVAAYAISSFVALKVAAKLLVIRETLTVLSEGKFDNLIDDFGSNTLDDVFSRMKSLQIRFGAEFDQAHENQVRSERIEHALMSATSNVMIADRFRSIIFINDSLQKMLKDVEPELQKILPQFDADNLLHQSIDMFHLNPEHQRKILDDLSDVHNARIKIGEVSIDLTISPIFDDKGQRIGTISEWVNMTDQLIVEGQIETIINKAAEGELLNRIEAARLKDFERNVSESVNSLLANFSNTLTNLNVLLGKMGQGDLTDRMDGEFSGQLNSVKLAINNSLSNLEITLGNVKTGTESIGNMSKEVANASEDLSERTQRQAASLQETAASLEEITSTTQQTAENMKQADVLAKDTSSIAEHGIAAMKETITAMYEINDFSAKISEITGVIDSIAFQTNLLALNAAVEAARAGEHGRGFAVVAGEVRSLAQKSAEAAKDISTLISSTTSRIQMGTEHVENTNQVFEGMVEKIKELEGLVSEASQTSFEQAKGIEQINLAMSHLDGATQQNAALVEELSATAGHMSEQANEQAQFVSRFQLHSQGNGLKTVYTSRFADFKMAHNIWVVRIDSYLSGIDKSIDAANARLDNVCELGKWIYSEGQHLMHFPQMKELHEVHQVFHATVGLIMDAIEVNDLDSVNDNKRKVEELSQQVADLLDELDSQIAEQSNQASLSVAERAGQQLH
ncbi:methyl-accepting chemotaxis protein [uncultured Thiomicrorhabdus sp.]